MQATNDKMKKAIENLKKELSKIRTGRANPALLDTIQVDYYGTKTQLKNMANISAPEARLLVIQPWDVSQIAAIEKTILEADLGLTPNNDGKVIRIQVPQLTEERRRDLVKVVKKVGEEARVSVRMIRRDANEELKNQNLPEDDIRKKQELIQKETNHFIQEIDTLLVSKEKDIMNV
ncbi:MAG: ribosome recycling factor [Deltaproteobacteria bacterium RIFCSPHIGHO2_02_FULL_40_11]|nr:MAG: ribosome recycling factor [Deltaproteobacteria bacterium RIFCSPHIGHO2_02_FULL_40_11]